MNATAPRPDSGFFARAVCKGRHRLFFPPENENRFDRSRREGKAKAVCATCPVIADCREWARAHREPGVWGGETELERAAAGFAPSEPGTHIQRDLRRRAEQSIAAELALGDLSNDQLEAIRRLIQGDSECS